LIDRVDMCCPWFVSGEHAARVRGLRGWLGVFTEGRSWVLRGGFPGVAGAADSFGALDVDGVRWWASMRMRSGAICRAAGN
jgi:hypothetical protein